MAIATINPATGETVKTFDALSEAEIDDRIGRAAPRVRDVPPHDLRAAGGLDAGGGRRARGRGRRDRAGDDDRDGQDARVGARRGEEVRDRVSLLRAARGGSSSPTSPPTAAAVGASRAFARYQPLGPVLAVMPWNFPLWQVMRFAAPALMAGNVGLLKHASNVPQTALWIEDVFRRAGFPDGVFQTLLVGSDAVERVLRDPRVKAATLTGSTPRGTRRSRSVAGDVIKPTVLELGGSDPFVVMPSADIDAAARVAVTARCQNNGQSCIAAKRFIVHEDVHEEFARAVRRADVGVADRRSDGGDDRPRAARDRAGPHRRRGVGRRRGRPGRHGAVRR